MARLSIKLLMALPFAGVCTSCSTIAQETANFFLENNSATINSGKNKNTTGVSDKQLAKQQDKLKTEGKCPTCRGMGKTPDGIYECTVCKGTGKYTPQE